MKLTEDSLLTGLEALLVLAVVFAALSAPAAIGLYMLSLLDRAAEFVAHAIG